MYARVPQAMAQFVLKIEKLSHIMGPTPILKMALAYGLRPRLWLLALYFIKLLFMYTLKMNPSSSKARSWVFNLLLLYIWKASFINAAWQISALCSLILG